MYRNGSSKSREKIHLVYYWVLLLKILFTALMGGLIVLDLHNWDFIDYKLI